jgi:hypothetical protein
LGTLSPLKIFSYLQKTSCRKDNVQMPVQAMTGKQAEEPNRPPSVGIVVPDIESPQLPGNVIVWTGTASDPEGDRLLYQFWLNGPATGNV